ncbi:MAG: hypothetical protein L0G61_04720 [Staphylococcus equorum]|nr:hypothetical protein [Staphylococcus equorum]
MKCINVVGTSASGKTTFSIKLAQKLKLIYIEMDDLFWLDDWQESTDTIFFQKIQTKLDQAKSGFVIDGNYTRTTHIKWQDIDTVIWLDIPFTSIFTNPYNELFAVLFLETDFGRVQIIVKILVKCLVVIRLFGG